MGIKRKYSVWIRAGISPAKRRRGLDARHHGCHARFLWVAPVRSFHASVRSGLLPFFRLPRGVRNPAVPTPPSHPRADWLNPAGTLPRTGSAPFISLLSPNPQKRNRLPFAFSRVRRNSVGREEGRGKRGMKEKKWGH